MTETLSTLADDLDTLHTQPRAYPGPKCGMARVLSRIGDQSPELAARVLAAIDNDDIPASKIAETLNRNGHSEVDGQLVRRHRARGTYKGCRCPR